MMIINVVTMNEIIIAIRNTITNSRFCKCETMTTTKSLYVYSKLIKGTHQSEN